MKKLSDLTGTETGWFGIPGPENERFSTKVHLVRYGKPLCGAKLSPRQEFQFCADGICFRMIECKHCKAIVNAMSHRQENKT